MNVDWRKTMLSDGARITDAVRVLEESSLRIVLVIDGEKRLIGTVTDGDIRRGLIRHLRLDDPVTTVMNNSPVTASNRQTLDTILALMRQSDVLQVPVIDEHGRVSRLEFLQELTDRRILENPVLLMAGGSGQRLRPLTADVPKPMLKVGDKPLLESIIEQLIEAGFCNVYISIHYKGEVVRDYFGDGSSWGISIRYLEESVPLGTGGALGLLPATDSQFPLLVMNGDLLTKIDFGGLLAFHEEQGSDLTVCVREHDIKVPYGVVEVRDQTVCGMIEKPIQKFFVNAGIYVLNHDLVAELEKAAVVDMTDIIDLQITNKKKVNAFPIHEYWLDIGLIKQYEQAQTDILRFLGD